MSFNLSQGVFQAAEVNKSVFMKYFEGSKISTKRKRDSLKDERDKKIRKLSSGTLEALFSSLESIKNLSDFKAAIGEKKTDIKKFNQSLKLISAQVGLLKLKDHSKSNFAELDNINRVYKLSKMALREIKAEKGRFKEDNLVVNKGEGFFSAFDETIADEDLIAKIEALSPKEREKILFFNFCHYPKLTAKMPAYLKTHLPNFSNLNYKMLPESLFDGVLIGKGENSNEEGNRIKVNKGLLALESPYFSTLFFNGMAETFSSEITIDVDPQALKECLSLIFSKPNLHEASFSWLLTIIQLASRLQLAAVFKTLDQQLAIKIESLDATEENWELVVNGFFILADAFKQYPSNISKAAFIKFFKFLLEKSKKDCLPRIARDYLKEEFPLDELIDLYKKDLNAGIKVTSFLKLFLKKAIDLNSPFLKKILAFFYFYLENKASCFKECYIFFKIFSPHLKMHEILIASQIILKKMLLLEIKSKNSKIQFKESQQRVQKIISASKDYQFFFLKENPLKPNQTSNQKLTALAEKMSFIPWPGMEFGSYLARIALSLEPQNKKALFLIESFKVSNWHLVPVALMEKVEEHEGEILALEAYKMFIFSDNLENINSSKIMLAKACSQNPTDRVYALESLFNYYARKGLEQRSWPQVYEKAIKAYKMNPHNELALALLGASLLQYATNISIKAEEKENQLKNAKIYLRKALSINPKNSIALLNMAKLQLQKNNLESAKSYFNKINDSLTIFWDDKRELIQLLAVGDIYDKQRACGLLLDILNHNLSSEALYLFASLALEHSNSNYLAYAKSFLEKAQEVKILNDLCLDLLKIINKKANLY